MHPRNDKYSIIYVNKEDDINTQAEDISGNPIQYSDNNISKYYPSRIEIYKDNTPGYNDKQKVHYQIKEEEGERLEY